MLKSWLRDLPTEIFPKTLQHTLADELAEENADYQKIGQPAPQRLRDALSNLPPFNYYLLFAITCHLSLLLSHKEKNKMDLNNLSICIGPCLDLERWLFNYLVGDWRHCWQGCFTEKQYLEAEKAHEQGVEYQMPASESESISTKIVTSGANVTSDERAVHSSGSSTVNVSSRKGSGQEETKAEPKEASSQVQNENSNPDTYKPEVSSKQTNGSAAAPERRPVPSQETKRPSTSGKASNTDDKKDATSKTKTQPHSRSQSDLPSLSPVRPQPSLELPFQTPGQ